MWSCWRAGKFVAVAGTVDRVEELLRSHAVHASCLEKAGKGAYAPLLGRWAVCCTDSQRLAEGIRSKLAESSQGSQQAKQGESSPPGELSSAAATHSSRPGSSSSSVVSVASGFRKLRKGRFSGHLVISCCSW